MYPQYRNTNLKIQKVCQKVCKLCQKLCCYVLGAYKSEKSEILHLSFLLNHNYDNHEFLKEQNILWKPNNTLQHQLYAFSNLKTKNSNFFIKFPILLSDDIQVTPVPNSNLWNSCGIEVNKRWSFFYLY